MPGMPLAQLNELILSFLRCDWSDCRYLAAVGEHPSNPCLAWKNRRKTVMMMMMMIDLLKSIIEAYYWSLLWKKCKRKISVEKDIFVKINFRKKVIFGVKIFLKDEFFERKIFCKKKFKKKIFFSLMQIFVGIKFEGQKFFSRSTFLEQNFLVKIRFFIKDFLEKKFSLKKKMNGENFFGEYFF